ncbi:YfaZ family outer membrane protein [Shewanella gaetbuli]|uniref:YfaZ family protein n=1 Tax=Shewanella gaetbuli TaxID=220752 RepID=A0A9X1ZRK7_9GAMM|nr:YfaZ family outer membrane protein [Shewanella gaetbuli]MCL1144322.1 YfaZ family protein [Shewanella gaetbuli]
MKKYVYIPMLLAALSSSVYAADFNFNLSEDVASIEMRSRLSDNATFGGGYTYSDKKGQLAHFSILMTHEDGPHSFAIGPKFVHVWFDDAPNGNAVAVGGQYSLQVSKNISLIGGGYYAPSVLSFSNLDGYTEYEGKVQYRFNPNLAIYVGYKKSRFKYEHTRSRTFEDGVFFGIGSRF